LLTWDLVLDPRFGWAFIASDKSWGTLRFNLTARASDSTDTRRASVGNDDLEGYITNDTDDPAQIYRDEKYTYTSMKDLWAKKFIDCFKRYKAEHFPEHVSGRENQKKSGKTMSHFFLNPEDFESGDKFNEEEHSNQAESDYLVPDEVRRYFDLPPWAGLFGEDGYVDENSIDLLNPLDWWRKHEDEFPVLARMARDILAISGSSVEVERVFSNARGTADWHQSRMKSPAMKALVAIRAFLRYNVNVDCDEGEEEEEEVPQEGIPTTFEHFIAEKILPNM
jgi:hypothetical protein